LVAFFVVFRAARFLVVRRFAGFRAVFLVVRRLAAFFLVARFLVARFFVVRLAALRVVRFFVVRLAALRFAGFRAAFFRPAAFLRAGLFAAFFLAARFLVARFLVAFFGAAGLGSGAGALGASNGDGSGRGSGRGGGGGHVLPELAPSSPESPPPDGGHVGVMDAEPSLSARRALVKNVPEQTTGIASRLPVLCTRGDGDSKSKRPRRSGVVRPKVPRWSRSDDQENDCPHPQVRVVFGLLIVKPASCSPSL
jgi:hypothetical protein